MLIGSFVKQPREVLPVEIVYADVVAGQTFTSITCTVETPSGMTKVVQELTGTTLLLYVGGGTTGTGYRWTFLTSIVIGGRTTVVEDEIDVAVIEV